MNLNYIKYKWGFLYFSMMCCIFIIGCSSRTSQINGTEQFIPTQEYSFPTADDVDGNLYFTCKNWNTDIYIGNSLSPYQNICIISLVPINLEDIQITVPIQNDYVVYLIGENYKDIHLTDYLLNKDRDIISEGKLYSDLTFPYYLYQCYRGTDWEKMKKLYDASEEAKKQQLQWNGSLNDDEYIKLNEVIEAYTTYRDMYLEDYNKLNSEDLPTLYYYDFNINFGCYATSYDQYGFTENYEYSPNIVSETFNQIEIKIGEKIYLQDIGEVRLHAENFPSHMKQYTDFDYIEVDSWSTGSNSYPWGNGLIRTGAIRFSTKEDLTLTKMYLYESDINEIGAYIIVSDYNGNFEMDFYWDLKSPIFIEKRKKVEIRLIAKDLESIQLEYGARCYPVIEYIVGMETFALIQEHNVDRWANVDHGIWLRYAVVFDGLSEEVQSYFDDFYRPIYEEWREGLN